MGSKYLIIKIGKFFFIACDVCVNVKKFDDSLIENFFFPCQFTCTLL